MKKFLLGTIGLAALSAAAPASAADLAARPYTKAPPMVAAIYDWSGFYIGGNGGWGSSRNCWDFIDPAGLPVPEGCHRADGGVVGGQIGYRWMSGPVVFGVEGQGDWADLRRSQISTAFPAFTNRSRIDAFGLITGQVGYAWNNALFYFKGGAAVTSNRYDVLTTVGNVLAANSLNETRGGGTVGVGFEYGFAPNWSVGVEYDHLFLERRNVAFTNNGFFGPARTTLFENERISQDVDLFTARINYRWGGPIIGKY